MLEKKKTYKNRPKTIKKMIIGTYVSGFPGGSDSKESACNAGDQGSIPESRRFPGEGNGYTLQYFCLENSMAREAWQAIQSMVLQRFGYDLSD